VDVPVLKEESPIEIRDGSFWAACTYGGKEETRPVFLTGYGHFPPVVEDLPVFSKIGINVIQIEIGTEGIVHEDGVSTDEITQFVIPALDRARDNGVRVCLLVRRIISRYGRSRNGRNCRSRNRLSEEHARCAAGARHLPKTTRSADPDDQGPSRAAIDLPQQRTGVRGRAERPVPPAALAQIHRAETQNDRSTDAAYGTTYASFEEVPHPKVSFSEKPAPLYDAVRCNQECFAEWHAWMAGVIREFAPNLPCHAKVMALADNRGTEFWGTDPWDFAKLSQINGNDCSFLSLGEREPWASNWVTQNMYYDLQRSMKRVPVFNTETTSSAIASRATSARIIFMPQYGKAPSTARAAARRGRGSARMTSRPISRASSCIAPRARRR